MATMVSKIGAFLMAAVLVAALNGCVTGDRGTPAQPGSTVDVGGRYGVVVEHGGPNGTYVTVGGNKGVVVGNPPAATQP